MFYFQILAYHAEEECDVQTLLIAIGGVVDMLLLYGLDLMAAPDEELSETRNEQHRVIFTGGTSLTSIIQGLVDLMDDDVSISYYFTKHNVLFSFSFIFVSVPFAVRKNLHFVSECV